jgi:Mala s 1-like protein
VLVSAGRVWVGSVAGVCRRFFAGRERRPAAAGAVGCVASGRGGLSARLPAVLGLGVVCALALGGGVAWAEAPKLVPYGQFNAKTPLPVGVAVDQSSGDVYASGLLNLSTFEPSYVSKFDASGGLLSPPSPFGGGYDSGVAVSPANGDVYVLSRVFVPFGTPPVMDVYGPGGGGAPVASFPVAESNNVGGEITVVQIAVDSGGNVYVPVVPDNEVLEYSPAGILLKTFTGGSASGALKGPTGVAVDSSGDLWVSDAGDNRIEELSPGDVQVGEVKSEGVESASLDGHGDLFAIVKNKADFCGEVQSPCEHLVEYSSAGVQIADLGAGSFGSQTRAGLPSMVAVNEATGLVYVSDPLKELVWIYSPPAPPLVSRELTSEVTTSEAKLGALVSPGGIPTSYRFEYDTREYGEGEGPHGQSTPFPEGSVGEGFAPHTVWAAASGLAPGTTYHYRVVASNELGTTYGPDRTFTTLTAAQAACSNSEFRAGFSVRLPDCRAYELVTAPPKNSSQPWSAGPVAANGETFGFLTEEPLSGSPTPGVYYRVTRGPAGWSEEDIMPLESYTGILCVSEGESASYSNQMSKVIIDYGIDSRASKEGTGSQQEACNAEGIQIVPGEPVGYENLLVRDNATGMFRLVNMPPAGVTPADAHVKGASADLSHVFFTEMAPLTPGAPYGVENLFEWDEGVLRLLTVVKGAPVSGSLVGEPNAQDGNQAISADGSHVLFASGGGLYDRIDGEHTVQLDEKAQGGSGPSGGGVFRAASADGSSVLFLDESRLTAVSTAESKEPDLYECEIVEVKGSLTCKLTDLTVAKTGEHADVLSVSELGSQDSSHVYFTAKGVLATNKREYEYTDNEGMSHKVTEEAKNGEDNLYVEQSGSIVYIATLSEGGKGAVSPNGKWLAFDSRKSLTGYDNKTGAERPAEEIFLYDTAAERLECVSCAPSGEAPVGGGVVLPQPRLRPLSDGGRVFFETAEALVPSDTNGQMDVYEYEGGQPSLISTGTSTNDFPLEPQSFVGASETGGDVFFKATQSLVPQDTSEDAVVVYDARVDGGFPAIAAPPACTTADACRSAVSPQPPIYGAPSSQTFSGVGNLTPSTETTSKKAKPKKKKLRCRAGFVKRKGRCVKGKARGSARKSNHRGSR